jgi:hypothetical protein
MIRILSKASTARMKRVAMCVAAFGLLDTSAVAQSATVVPEEPNAPGLIKTVPRTFARDAAVLAEQRRKVVASPAEFGPALTVLRLNAEKALRQGPWSVTDKTQLPPSGDKQDYMSIGPYWWPDPSSPDGLPYVRRDGETNPERYDYDNVRLKSMVHAVEALADAWYFTEDSRYAEHAALLLRTWFLDPATRMNPHLRYAQAIKGISEGRDIGIIDAAAFVRLVDAVGLLQLSDAWSAADQAGLERWFRDYLDWLLASPHGQSESKRNNNHAVWYAAQATSIALFIGDHGTARKLLADVGPRLLDRQVAADGRLPEELARTRSFSYTAMTLRAFLHLACMGEHVGVDLWRYRGDDGQSLQKALEWFEPFVAGRADWQYEQITPVPLKEVQALYRQAARAVGNPTFRDLAARVEDPLVALLHPLP